MVSISGFNADDVITAPEPDIVDGIDFCTWNCRGLACKSNNKLLEPDFLHATRNADVILLSETWSKESHDIVLPGYQATVCHRPGTHRKAVRASGGIAALISNYFIDKVEVVETFNDLYMWLRINCDDHYFLLVFVYIPPGSLNRNRDRDNIFELLIHNAVRFRAEYGANTAFGTCGDTNLRTGTEDDLVRGDNDRIGLLFDEYVVDEVMIRHSLDKLCKPEGRIQLNYCKEVGQRILNGRFGSDKGVGEFTYSFAGSGPPRKSVIDYVMISVEHLDNIQAFEIGSHWGLSDHFPLHWRYGCSRPPPPVKATSSDRPLKWGPEHKQPIHQVLLDNINELSDIVDGPGTACEVTDRFTDKLHSLVKPIMLPERPPSRPPARDHGNSDEEETSQYEAFRCHRSRPKEPWFCETCGELRESALTHLNFHRLNLACEVNKTRYDTASRRYNSHKKSCKCLCRISNTRRVMSLKVENSRHYWRILNGGGNRAKPNISNEELAGFFKEVNSPADMSPFQTSAETRNFLDNVTSEELEPKYAELDIDFSIEEVTKVIRCSKNNKAAGSDGLIYELFKKCYTHWSFVYSIKSLDRACFLCSGLKAL